jgi:hypothetical protein
MLRSLGQPRSRMGLDSEDLEEISIAVDAWSSTEISALGTILGLSF